MAELPSLAFAVFLAIGSMVGAGIYPIETDKFEDLRDLLNKLNDVALSFEPESSAALGSCFRVGFLGMLHMEVVEELIPRQLFGVAIQASIGNTIIARINVKSMGRNVTAKCYGGDITLKRKLLEKQKAGKKRMKAIGKVDVPQEAFMAVLKIDS